mmetsp:Transcript_65556/g.213483  ORF Transcript_65556/g.213483 Transcript_65556/m.213483 type:complete len:653 (+) Transcript_65556:51-2009(+)
MGTERMAEEPRGEGLDPAGVVTLQLPGGHQLVVSKTALVARAAFFAPLADEAGPACWGEGDWGHLASTLSPGAREALPALLARLGAASAPPEVAWGALFEDRGLFQVFAAAHLLGATDVVEAARAYAAADAPRLTAAVAALDASAEGAALRAAARHGIDERSTLKLLHAAAAADAAGAVEVIVSEEDALGDAAARGDIAGALSPIDQRDASGHTALHVCAVHNSAAAAAALLEASASLDALCDPLEEDDDEVAECGQEGGRQKRLGLRTALHLAAANDSAEVVQLLLDRRADVAACVKGVHGALTPLHECAAGDGARAARILATAAVGAARIFEPWNFATVAEGGGAGDSAQNSQEGEAGENAGVRWSRFLDPLQAKIGNLGLTPLHTAAEEDAPGVVRVLLEAKADPGLSDDQGDTPVHYAVLYAAPRALGELLSSGADVLCENAAGELPLHQVAEFGLGDSGDAEMPATFLKRHFARSFRVQQLLLDTLRSRGQLAAALRHASDHDGNMPLHAVALRNHLGAAHAARLLVEANAELEGRNADGRTPLCLAIKRYGSKGLVAKALLQLGARKPEQDDTALLPGALGGQVQSLVQSAPAGQQVNEEESSLGAASEGSASAAEPGRSLCEAGAAGVELPVRHSQDSQNTFSGQ